MAPSFFGEVSEPSDHKENLLAQLGVYSEQREEIIYLISSCSSIEQFEEEIHGLKNELENILIQVKAKWDRLSESCNRAINQNGSNDPESIWQNMEACDSDKEMIDYFNGFDEEFRKRVAEYILSNVNMFQGKAPVFASHYNMFTFRLE